MSDFDVGKILNIFNYFDGVIITDKNGVIKYYVNFRKDVYNLGIDEIVGKTLMEIHPEMDESESTIMTVLKTGQPIYDHVEHLVSVNGDRVTNIVSTLPIIEDGEIVGAIDLSRSIDDERTSRSVQRMHIEMPKMMRESDTFYHLSDIISSSQKINEIKSIIPMIANTDSAVMIYGETGTGKEMIAQSIHSSGVRANGRFISQNCAAIPANLLESILFGTEKGSFTGAEDKAGLFELADGGTLFLDEINSMDLMMQAKILKAIEEKQVRRIGGSLPISFDVKVISATNKDPIECVREGIIREDLFYRLGTVLLELPPLRERIADIPIMTNYFIEKNNYKMNKAVVGVTNEVMDFFYQYPWPGNVRELKNVIEGAFNVIGSSQIGIEDLPPYMTKTYEDEKDMFLSYSDSLSLTEKVDEYEKKLIIKALDSTKNVSSAAAKLKISKQKLHYKLQKYGLGKNKSGDKNE